MNFTGHNSKITWAADRELAKKRAEKQCPLPSVKMIGPAGQVVEVATANGRGVPQNRNLYGPQIVPEKEKAGWVRYDSLPEKKREELIAQRKAAQAERGEAFARQTMTEGQAMIEVMRKLAGQNPGNKTEP